MADSPITISPSHPARMKLEPYTLELHLQGINVGVDNIHYDVYLSPKFTEPTRKYLLDSIRAIASLNFSYSQGRNSAAPDTAGFRKQLFELLQTSLTRAKYAQNIEVDVLNRLAVLKFLLSEISSQFSSLIVECKEWIHSRGVHFERSEQAHVMRSRIAELQAERRSIYRQVGMSVYQIMRELDENALSKSRRALFGEEFPELYELFRNRFLFLEGGTDETLLLENYVLLGTFIHDPDRFEVFEELLLDFVRDFVHADENAEELSRSRKSYERLMEQARTLRAEAMRLEEEQEEIRRKAGGGDDLFAWPWKRRPAGTEPSGDAEELRKRGALLELNLEELGPGIEAAKQRMEFLTEEYRARIGNYLYDPENIRRLFDARAVAVGGEAPAETRERLLREWINRLDERDLLAHVFAGYELRKIYMDYSPPVHLQQLKKALVDREETKRVEQVIGQFPARKFSLKKLEEAARAIRRVPPEEVPPIALRFAEDFTRLRRDRRNYQHVVSWMERVSLVRSEHSRELSRANNSLYELVFADEAGKDNDPVVTHAVIKADVRGSSGMTKDLQSRGLNPASHISRNLHEPVKRLLDRYGAAKVFIEGDAIILAIYETESTRATQRAVAKACTLAREILAVTQAYNARPEAADLPRIELGIGVAFQNSAPSLWMDGDSRIMISKALNLSDRLSSCSKVARRLFAQNPSPFNVFLVQTLMEDTGDDDSEELLVRFNLNGIELNEEGFEKLSGELSLTPLAGTFSMPWGKDRVQLYLGELPLGNSMETIVIRKGEVRELLPGAKIGNTGPRAYYEVCTHPKLLEIARKKLSESSAKS